MTVSKIQPFVRVSAGMRWGERPLVHGSIGVAAFAAMTALGACVRIPLPWTPVPVTLQTLFVLLAGAALGPAWGAASQALYLTMGAAGLWGFAGGTGGRALLLTGPTTGYLFGFMLAAAVTGWLVRRQADPGMLRIVCGMAGGSVTIYVCGAGWLMWNLSCSVPVALALGVGPFVLGDLGKIFAAALLARAALQGDQRSASRTEISQRVR